MKTQKDYEGLPNVRYLNDIIEEQTTRLINEQHLKIVRKFLSNHKKDIGVNSVDIQQRKSMWPNNTVSTQNPPCPYYATDLGFGQCMGMKNAPKVECKGMEDEAHCENDNHICIMKKEEHVDHPSHYNQGGVECIEALAAATQGLDGIEAFCTANAIKYLWRWKFKNGAEDLDKAIWYINYLKEILGKNN